MKYIYTDLLPRENRQLEEVFGPLGYQVIYMDSQRYDQLLKRESESGDRPDAWEVAVMSQEEHLLKMQKVNVATIGYERKGGEQLTADQIILSLDALDVMDIKKAYCHWHHIPLEVMTTERTVIREFALDKREDLLEMYHKPGMLDYMDPGIANLTKQDYQEAYIENAYKFFGYGMWVVLEKETGRFIGLAGVDSTDACDGMALELGYMIEPGHQNQGYATEACQAIVRFAFEDLEVDRLIARVNPANIPSIIVLQRLGFHKVGDMLWEKTEL